MAVVNCTTVESHSQVLAGEVNGAPRECNILEYVSNFIRSLVFNVAWSPLVPNILLSGSNDRTARVWDVESGTCTRVLQGHTQNVRGLAWHPEIHHIVITGSWDATVRVWDTQTGESLACCKHHVADVYGISMHPQRPFALATVSRDSTVRIWSLTQLLPGPMISCILGKKFRCDQERGSGTYQDPSFELSGPCSRNLENDLAAYGTKCERFQSIFRFFYAPGPADVLWNLARRVCKLPPDASSTSGKTMLFHTDVHRALKQRFNDKMMNFDSESSGVRAPRSFHALEEASSVDVRAGNVRRYCETLLSQGEWDKAAAAAPAVSMSYWREVMGRRAVWLAKGGKVEDCVTSFIVCGRVEDAVAKCLEEDMYDQAFELACMHASGGYSRLLPSSDSVRAPSDHMKHSMDGNASYKVVNEREAAADYQGKLESLDATDRRLRSDSEPMRRIRSMQAAEFQKTGQPIMAACCQLSIDDTEEALHILLAANEIDLATALLMAVECQDALKSMKTISSKIRTCFAMRCEAAGLRKLAAEVLHTLDDAQAHVEQLSIRLPKSMPPEEVDAFYLAVGLEAPGTYTAKAEGASTQTESIRLLLLGRNFADAANKLVAALHSTMSKPKWTFDEVEPLVGYIFSIDPSTLADKEQVLVQAYQNLIGSHIAWKEGYFTVSQFLLREVRSFTKKHGGALELSFPISTPEINYLEARAIAGIDENASLLLLSHILEATDAPDSVKASARHLDAEIRRGAMNPCWRGEQGRGGCQDVASATGAILRHSSVASGASGEPVSSPSVELKTGKFLSLPEAIMLSRVMWPWALNVRDIFK
eukprot:evm.model.scf_469.5 EVM.evm.TU.scf_469.5   scf_469:36329-42880(+)